MSNRLGEFILISSLVDKASLLVMLIKLLKIARLTQPVLFPYISSDH
jgi:hypothetical protein